MQSPFEKIYVTAALIATLALAAVGCGGGGSTGGVTNPQKECKPACNATYQTCNTSTGQCVDKSNSLTEAQCYDIVGDFLGGKGYPSLDCDIGDDFTVIPDFEKPDETIHVNCFSSKETGGDDPYIVDIFSQCGGLISSELNLINELNASDSPQKVVGSNGTSYSKIMTDILSQYTLIPASLARESSDIYLGKSVAQRVVNDIFGESTPVNAGSLAVLSIKN
ncbi:MAG: hypothetical protein ABIA21_00160 [Candidatus Aenigmatarchaeota archaeon]